MKKLFRYLKLYRKILSFAIMKALAYSRDFIVWSIVDTMWGIVNIGFFWVLFQKIPLISGWTFDQLTIPLGILYLLNTFIWGFMYANMNQLSRDVNLGDLDLYLIKPVDSQFLVSTRSISLSLLPSIAAGLILLRHGFITNNLSFKEALIIPMALFSSVIISYSLWFISVTTVFWFNRLRNIGEVFGSAVDIARYPAGIFNPFIKFIFTFIIPFAMLGFLPAEVMLGRAGLLNLFWPLFLALFFLYLSHKFWIFSLQRYSSASS